MTLKTYPLKLVESINIEVKTQAAINRMTMQDWMVKAIQEKLERDRVV